MAKYRVKAPDGSLHDINGPDDATPADIEAQASRLILSAKPESSPPGMWDKFKEGAGNLAMGTVKGLADPVYGLTQLGLHGLNSLTGGGLSDISKQYDDRLSGIENQYQADTPGSVAAGVGRIAGNLAMPVKGAQLLKGASALPRAINAAVTGGAIGAMQPVTNAEDFATTKGIQVGAGAVGGGALSIGGSALGGAFNTIRPLVAPNSAAGNIILRGLKQTATDATAKGDSQGAAMADPAALIQRLNDARSLVPGSLPTTAQVGGLPQLVMAEKTLKNNPSYRPAFEDRAISNNQARLAALKNIAGTPAEIESAIDARTAAMTPVRQAVLDNGSPVNVNPLLDRLSASQNSPIGTNPVVGGALADIQNQIRSRASADKPGPYSPSQLRAEMNGSPGLWIKPDQLDGIRQNATSYVRANASNGAVQSQEVAGIEPARQAITDAISHANPGYRGYLSDYAKNSVPINTMETGKAILDSLERGTMNAAGDVSPVLSQFRSQYNSAMKNAPYGIDPAAKTTLDAIESDLQRETISNSIKSSGSDTYFNAQAPNWLASKIYGSSLDGKSALGNGMGALAGLLTGGPMGAAGGYMAGQKMGAFAGQRVNTALQNAMLDPQTFARLLQEAANRSSAQSGGLLAPKAGALAGDGALSGLLSGS